MAAVNEWMDNKNRLSSGQDQHAAGRRVWTVKGWYCQHQVVWRCVDVYQGLFRIRRDIVGMSL